MQLFTLADHRRVAAGEFKVTFRLWKRPHVKVGATYPTGFTTTHVRGYELTELTELGHAVLDALRATPRPRARAKPRRAR